MNITPKFGVVFVAASSHQFRGDRHTTFLTFWTFQLSTINQCSTSNTAVLHPERAIVCTETATAIWKPEGVADDHPTRTVREQLLQKEVFVNNESHGGYESMNDRSKSNGN